MERIDKNGKRIPSKSMLENATQSKPLFYRDGLIIFWLLLALWSLQY